MKPAPFVYHRPRTVDEVLATLRRYGGEARLLAGGQSLVPALNLRLARPQALIDLNRVDGLDYIRIEGGELAVGAMTRHVLVERSELVARRQPLLGEAVGHIGHFQIRNRGTIGGSLAHADPAAELPAVLACLDGSLLVTGADGTRRVGWGEFFLSCFTTRIGPDELLTEVRVPLLPPGAGYAFVEAARRHGDFALAAVACMVTLAADGTVAGVRLALTGVDLTPVRARAAEQYLLGQMPAPDRLAEAGHLAAGATAPETDVHATAAYRRHLAGVLTARALARAAARVGGVKKNG